MPAFGLFFSRPDKRDPMTLWFTEAMHADRTAQSIMHMTAKDYGCKMEFYSPAVGYRENFKHLVRKTGETRLRVMVACFEDAPAGVIVHDRPLRITCWARAKADEITHWMGGARAPIPSVDRPKKEKRTPKPGNKRYRRTHREMWEDRQAEIARLEREANDL